MFSFASADITPHRPVPLGGYGWRTSEYAGIADPLEANFVVIRQGEREVVLVTADLLYCGEDLRRALLERLGLTASPECLFLGASHTHGAPMTQSGIPKVGIPDQEYVQFAADRIAVAITKVRRNVAPAWVTYHNGRANHSMNRRLKRLRITPRGLRYSSDMGPNPDGERDEEVSVLRICSGQGDVRAVIWSYACHPTGRPGLNMVSADYPGVVRQQLRQRYGPIPVLFLQGFSGDLRPPFGARVTDMRSLVLRICLGPLFGRPNLPEWQRWADSLGQYVCQIVHTDGVKVKALPLCSTRCAVDWPGVRWWNHNRRDLAFHLVMLGQIAILGISAEVVSSYRRLVEKLFANYKVIPVGCIDQTWAYLPTDGMLPEGGYEVEGFAPYFDFPGTYQGNLENDLAAGLVQLRNAITN